MAFDERIITSATQRRVAELAGIAAEDWMQDWPLEVADPDRVEEFLGLLERATDDETRHVAGPVLA